MALQLSAEGFLSAHKQDRVEGAQSTRPWEQMMRVWGKYPSMVSRFSRGLSGTEPQLSTVVTGSLMHLLLLPSPLVLTSQLLF